MDLSLRKAAESHLCTSTFGHLPPPPHPSNKDRAFFGGFFVKTKTPSPPPFRCFHPFASNCLTIFFPFFNFVYEDKRTTPTRRRPSRRPPLKKGESRVTEVSA